MTEITMKCHYALMGEMLTSFHSILSVDVWTLLLGFLAGPSWSQYAVSLVLLTIQLGHFCVSTSVNPTMYHGNARKTPHRLSKPIVKSIPRDIRCWIDAVPRSNPTSTWWSSPPSPWPSQSAHHGIVIASWCLWRWWNRIMGLSVSF